MTSCTFSKNDLYLVTTSWDKTIRIYDVKTGSYRSSGPAILKHDGCVNDCAFSSDGMQTKAVFTRQAMNIIKDCRYDSLYTSDQLLVSCGFDKTINIWDMKTCSLKKHYMVFMAAVKYHSYCINMALWCSIQDHRSWIYCCEFSPSDKWLISGFKVCWKVLQQTSLFTN